MLKIGDFSKLGQVAVSTLRYYDEIGLLKPTRIDPWTNYRWYTVDQLLQLNRIIALRDLGLSLEQITQLLQEHVPVEQLQGMLRLKQAQLQQEVEQSQSRLARVEARLQLLSQEDLMQNYDVVHKHVPATSVVLARTVVPHINDLPHSLQRLFGEVAQQAQQAGLSIAGAWQAIYYHPEYTETNLDVAAAVPIVIPTAAAEKVWHELPGVQVVSVIHHGPFETISQAYLALGQWIDAHNYQITGPCREVYLSSPNEPSPTTEIQFPIEPGSAA